MERGRCSRGPSSTSTHCFSRRTLVRRRSVRPTYEPYAPAVRKKESTRVAKSRARRSGDIRHCPQRKDGLRYKQESKNEKGATISKASAAERVLQFEEGESDKACVRSAQCEVRDRMPSARTHARRVPSLAVASTASHSLSATTTSAVWPALALFRLRNAQ